MTDGIVLSLWQKLVLRILGQVYIGHRQHEGWTGSLPFYAFKCPVHGLVEDYPHGYRGVLRCSQCA